MRLFDRPTWWAQSIVVLLALLPGVSGVICLILAFMALGSLPVNWGGIVLIGLAFFLFILDLKVTGFALSVAGAISFVLGSLFLFSPFAPGSPTMPRLTVSPWLLVLMTVLLVGFFSFAVTAGLRAQRQATILRAEGDRQATILRAEGDRQAAILRAEGFSLALEKIFNGVVSGAEDRLFKSSL